MATDGSFINAAAAVTATTTQQQQQSYNMGFSVVSPPPPSLPPGCVSKVATRVEWENDSVDVFIDEDEEALLMTAEGGIHPSSAAAYHRSEELFSCLQKLVIASMSIGLVGLGVACIFLIEYIAGW